MTKRKYVPSPGWDRQTVSWSYSVAFKKPRGHRLRWISTYSQDVAEASREAQAFVEELFPGEDLIEYGVSPSYYRHWGGYDEYITQEEYEFAAERGLARSPIGVEQRP